MFLTRCLHMSHQTTQLLLYPNDRLSGSPEVKWETEVFFLFLSVCVQAQRTSAALFPEGRVLRKGVSRCFRPQRGDAREL